MIEPLGDRIVIQRIEEPGSITLTDAHKSIKGVVLAVGLGKWHLGEWWKLKGKWEWFDGYYETPEVKPGDKVLFNSRWNDFAAGENKGTGCDGKGPLERPLPLRADPLIHLVQEADIIAIVPHFDFTASIKPGTVETTYMRNIEIKGPWNS